MSRIHASIIWNSACWELHNHGRNGTLVSGVLIGEGQHVALRIGDIIHLGNSASPPLYVANLDAPADMLWREATAALPCTAQFEPSIQRIEFNVSRDEEHVAATLHSRGAALDLGMRAHHYCLVTLARKRYADAQAGYDGSSQGWIDLDVLAHMLGLVLSHVNVQIHRARMQFGTVLTPGCAELVERRRGSVRFGSLSFRIVRADALECQWPAGDIPDYWPTAEAAAGESSIASTSAS